MVKKCARVLYCVHVCGDVDTMISSQKGCSQNDRSQSGRSQNGRESTNHRIWRDGRFFYIGPFFAAFLGTAIRNLLSDVLFRTCNVRSIKTSISDAYNDRYFNLISAAFYIVRYRDSDFNKNYLILS